MSVRSRIYVGFWYSLGVTIAIVASTANPLLLNVVLGGRLGTRIDSSPSLRKIVSMAIVMALSIFLNFFRILLCVFLYCFPSQLRPRRSFPFVIPTLVVLFVIALFLHGLFFSRIVRFHRKLDDDVLLATSFILASVVEVRVNDLSVSIHPATDLFLSLEPYSTLGLGPFDIAE